MRRIAPRLAAAIVVTVLAAPGTALGVGWIDADGVVHFEDPPRRAKRRTPAPSTKRGVETDPRVEIYLTAWCPACRKARDWFKSRGLQFSEYDIEKDAGAAARKHRIDGTTTIPVVVIDGKVIRGFAPKQFEAAIAAR